jgi:hypothetical protein
MAYFLALLFCVSIAPSAGNMSTGTSDAASDSLWAYRNRLAASATNLSVKMKAMVLAQAKSPSKEYRYMDKANDALLEASWLLAWTCDIVHMQREMCEPKRSQYVGVVVDRVQRTRDTLSALHTLLMDDAAPGDQKTMFEILARNRDMAAATRTLDSMLERFQDGPATGGGSSGSNH